MTEPLVDQPRVLCPHGRHSRLTCQDCIARSAYLGLDPRQCDREGCPERAVVQILAMGRARVYACGADVLAVLESACGSGAIARLRTP